MRRIYYTLCVEYTIYHGCNQKHILPCAQCKGNSYDVFWRCCLTHQGRWGTAGWVGSLLGDRLWRLGPMAQGLQGLEFVDVGYKVSGLQKGWVESPALQG